MAASDALSGPQFEGLTYQTISRRDDANKLVERGVAFVQGNSNEAIGHLTWKHPTGEISDVVVAPKHRRKGLATKMLAKARELEPRVHHSNQMTPDGVEWAKAVGGRRSDARS